MFFCSRPTQAELFCHLSAIRDIHTWVILPLSIHNWTEDSFALVCRFFAVYCLATNAIRPSFSCYSIHSRRREEIDSYLWQGYLHVNVREETDRSQERKFWNSVAMFYYPLHIQLSLYLFIVTYLSISAKFFDEEYFPQWKLDSRVRRKTLLTLNPGEFYSNGIEELHDAW